MRHLERHFRQCGDLPFDHRKRQWYVELRSPSLPEWKVWWQGWDYFTLAYAIQNARMTAARLNAPPDMQIAVIRWRRLRPLHQRLWRRLKRKLRGEQV